jgi:uncharacterized damage-inducible protein DinB
MTVNDLERLYDYGYWANRKLVPVIAQLTPEQFTRNVAGSYGSVRNTLVHIMSAEGAADRRGGQARAGSQAQPSDAGMILETGDGRDARARLPGVARRRDLQRSVEFKMPGSDQTDVMLLGDLMQHAANHAVHHRGQVALLLRALGQVPGNFDLLVYDFSPERAVTT